MEIPQVIRDLSAQIGEGCNATVSLAGSVLSVALGLFQSFGENEFNQNWIQPWFERNVYPLQEKDYALIFISLAASAALLAYVWDRFGDAALPLGLCGACLIVGTSLFITRNSVKTYFDEKAWEHLDRMKQAAEDITNLNQDFTMMTKEREELQSLNLTISKRISKGLTPKLKNSGTMHPRPILRRSGTFSTLTWQLWNSLSKGMPMTKPYWML